MKQIDNNLFKTIKNVNRLQLETFFFRKLIHKHGLEWIRSINSDLYMNDSDISEYVKYQDRRFLISLFNLAGILITDMFPDEDFCLYSTFPFYRHVMIDHFPNTAVFKISCTYLWLNRYFLYSKSIYFEDHFIDFMRKAKSNMSPCDFEKLMKICNKTEWRRVENIWDLSDTKSLNKGIRIFLSITSYLLSLFGIFTNLIVVLIIWSKSNKEIFKDLNQYPYLGVLSVCHISILLLQILSWISDCKNTLDLFCPETRKLIPIQFFKVLF